MAHKSPANRRRESDQRAATRREARREMDDARDAAMAASGTGPQSQNISPMKGTQKRQGQKMREAKKAGQEKAF